MLKKEVVSHLAVSLIWLVIITLLRWQWQWNLIWLWLGGAVGTFLLDIDHLIYVFWLHPEEATSQEINNLFKQKNYRAVLVKTNETHLGRFHLTFHNALFQVGFLVMVFWVLSSSNSLFGKGLVMAMLLHLLKDELWSLLKKGDEFTRRWLFWPIKREISFQEQKIFIVLMILCFLGLNLLLL